MKKLTGNPFRTKALTLAQARECETAEKPKCVCRCGGAAHGAARLALNMENTPSAREADRLLFTKLPDDDPHHLLPEREDEALTKLRAQIRKAHEWHVVTFWNEEGKLAARFAETPPNVRGYVSVGWTEPTIAEFDGPCPLCIEKVIPNRAKGAVAA